MKEQGFVPTLGALRDPKSFREPVELRDRSADFWLHFLWQMLRIRKCEEVISQKVESGVVKCPCHLSIGQEAIPVGITHYLRSTDRLFGTHRSHSLFLAVGGTPLALFAEILGRDIGCSRGMGSSMHLKETKRGFLGSVPIVAATVPIAVGAALAAQRDGNGDIGVCFLGDGAMEEGVVHESLNYASTFKLPVLFVCENNLFSSHVPIESRQPSDSVARFARAHGIPYKILDGNDVGAIESAAGQFIPKIREGEGPCFIEAITYRWKGHVGHREDLEVGLSRREELKEWKERDPIERLLKSLLGKEFLSRECFEKESESIARDLGFAWNQAMEADFPPASALLSRVFV